MAPVEPASNQEDRTQVLDNRGLNRTGRLPRFSRAINNRKSLNMTSLKVAIFPDNFAKYRVPAFRKISEIAGMDLTVFSPTPSRGNVAVAERGIDYSSRDAFAVVDNRNYNKGLHTLWNEGLVKAVATRRFDIVIAWGEVQNISVWIALICGKIFKRHVVIWTHGMYGTEGWLKKRLRVWQAGLAKAVFLYGNNARSILVRNGIPAEHLHVVYNSLDYRKQRELRDSLTGGELLQFRREIVNDGDPNTKVLLFVGRLIQARQGEVALSALRILREQGGDYRLLIIGDGPMLESYKLLAQEMELDDRVTFVGQTYSEEALAPYFMSADLCVCPGPIGLLAVHAHAYGLPVCTHDGARTKQKPEFEIVVPGETGCLFREGDAADLARRVAEWFVPPRDRRRVARACIDRVEAFYNPDAQARTIETAFRSIVER